MTQESRFKVNPEGREIPGEVLVTMEYPPTVKGGIQHTVLSLSEYLAEQDYNINLLFPDKRRFSQYEPPYNLAIRTWPVETIGPQWPLDQLPRRDELSGVLTNFSQEELKAVIVHSPDMLGLATLRSLQNQFKEITTIVWNSPLLFPIESFRELPTQELIRHVATEPLYWLRKQLWIAHHLEKYRSVFNSETNLETFRTVFGSYPKAPYEIIYPTSPLCARGNLQTSKPEKIDERLEGCFTILTTGRITRKKGIERLKNMVFDLDQTFSKAFPDTKLGLVVAGAADGQYAKKAISEFEELARVMKSTVCVTVPNPSNDRLKLLYDNSDLFIIPSVIEGFGLVTVEAGYHGLPVVGLKKYGSAEVIPKFREYGHLIQEINPQLSTLELDRLTQFVGQFLELSPEERGKIKEDIYEVTNLHFNPIEQHRRMQEFLGI